MDEVGVDRGEVVAVVERVHQPLAHRDQRLGAARRQVEPAKQLLAARLGGVVQLGGGDVARRCLPGRDGALEPLLVGAEAVRQRLEEGDARPGGQLGEAQQDVAGERGAGRLAAHRHELLAHVDQALRALLRGAAPAAGAVDQRPPAVGDGLQELAEERGVHRVIGP